MNNATVYYRVGDTVRKEAPNYDMVKLIELLETQKLSKIYEPLWQLVDVEVSVGAFCTDNYDPERMQQLLDTTRLSMTTEVHKQLASKVDEMVASGRDTLLMIGAESNLRGIAKIALTVLRVTQFKDGKSKASSPRISVDTIRVSLPARDSRVSYMLVPGYTF